MTRPLLFARRNPWMVAAFAAGFCPFVSTATADWTHYRGPAGIGVSTEKLGTVAATGLRPLWTASVGTGTSSVTVSGERAFTMGNLGGKDAVWCFDAKSGQVVWKHEYPLDVDKRMFEGGTAATPTVDGHRVYTVSHQGDLFCLDAATGKPVWYKHYQRDFGGQRPQWGYAGSVTVEGSFVLLDVGGKGASTVALDKATGSVVWKSGSDEAGYASPIVATIAGRRTVVMFKASALVGLDINKGVELWRQEWKTSYDVNAATPIVVGDQIFVSSGYGAGCALYAVSGGRVSERWRNKNMKAHINTPVFWQGHIYGIDGQADPKAPLVCLDLATGAVKWQEKNFGGALVLVGGTLVILGEKGELVIGDASPAGFKAAAREQVLGKRCWIQPTVANGRVFVRNNDGDLAVLGL